jgi:hypothetical protein
VPAEIMPAEWRVLTFLNDAMAKLNLAPPEEQGTSDEECGFPAQLPCAPLAGRQATLLWVPHGCSAYKKGSFGVVREDGVNEHLRLQT